MSLRDLFSGPRPVCSFEVFPPKRDGDVASLYRTFEELAPLKPDYISVTYGAGGTNKGLHSEINAKLLELGITPLAHFTCVGHSKDAIASQLDALHALGVRNILALRGDPPQGAARFERPPDGFGHASELIHFIRSRWDFCLGAACYPEVHPEAASAQADLAALKLKADAGADFFVTQMFFDNPSYFAFVKAARGAGVTQPIQPGILPVLSEKFFAREWGVRYPAGFKEGFAGAPPEAAETRGLDFAAAQCLGLLKEGAPGLHLYTMNKARASLAIHARLKDAGAL